MTQADAILQLRAALDEGATVYGIHRSTSRTGRTYFDLVVAEDPPLVISAGVAVLLGCHTHVCGHLAADGKDWKNNARGIVAVMALKLYNDSHALKLEWL